MGLLYHREGTKRQKEENLNTDACMPKNASFYPAAQFVLVLVVFEYH